MTLRDELRRATAAQHERLDALLDLTRPDLTSGDYAGYLARNYAVYAACEPRLEAAVRRCASHPGLARPRKLPWLELDLAHFGVAAPDETIEVALPPRLTLGETLGCAYVLEGATLGGAVLYRHFSRRWGMGPDSGARFLHGYGAETARMWKAFVELIEGIELAPGDRAACLSAARLTFTAFEASFARATAERVE